MPDASALVDLRNVTFSYGDRVILRDVSLQVPRGKVTALMGASGCLIPFDCDDFSRQALYTLLANVQDAPTAREASATGSCWSSPSASTV